MLGKPRIRQNSLKTNLRFPCLDLNPTIDSISLYRNTTCRTDKKNTIVRNGVLRFLHILSEKNEDTLEKKSLFTLLKFPNGSSLKVLSVQDVTLCQGFMIKHIVNVWTIRKMVIWNNIQ